MLNRRFNNRHKFKRCPICTLTTGPMHPQEGPLKDLGYHGTHYAHISCVVDARAEKVKIKIELELGRRFPNHLRLPYENA